MGYLFYNACNTCCKCRCFLNIYHPNCNLFENITEKPRKSFSISSCSERLKLPGKNSDAHPVGMCHLCTVGDYIIWLPRFWQSKAWWTKKYHTVYNLIFWFPCPVWDQLNSMFLPFRNLTAYTTFETIWCWASPKRKHAQNLNLICSSLLVRAAFAFGVKIPPGSGVMLGHGVSMRGKWFGIRRCYSKLEDPPAN